MPRLFVLSGDDVGHTHDFDTALTLGRAKEAGMRMRGASISRKHARIEPEGEGWKITDLGSANGVFVAGQRVQSALLEDGAEFRLGDVELRLRTMLPAASPPRPAPLPSTFEESAAQTQWVPDAVPPKPQPAPELEPEPEPAGDDGFELEGDWSDDPPPPVQVAAPRPAATGPAPARPAAAAAAGAGRTTDKASRRAAALGQSAAGSGARATTSGKRILQFNKVANEGGLGASELAQQPALVRWLLYALAAAVFAGIAWGAFELTRSMRERGSTNVEQDF